MSDLVGNPEDRFSRVAAHMIDGDSSYFPDKIVKRTWSKQLFLYRSKRL